MKFAKPEDRLRLLAVKKPTLERYIIQTNLFRTWAKAHRKSISDHSKLDSAMAQYLLELYEDGLHVWEGTYVVYGFQFLYNRQSDKDYLPLAKKSLKAWRKRQPSSMRLPVPEEVVWALGHTMLELGYVMETAAMVIQYVTYMRPSEAISLFQHQICPPIQGGLHRYEQWGFVLAPQELHHTTKTGEVDDSILVDCRPYAWVHTVLTLIFQSHRKTRVFEGLTLAHYERCFQQGMKALDVPLHVTPHVIRHSGASNDFVQSRKTLKQIQKHGRWACFKSCRRYEKGALILQAWAKLQNSQQQKVSQMARAFPTKLVAQLRRLKTR